MPTLFLETLLEGAQSYTMERKHGVIILRRAPGMETAFNALASSLMLHSEHAVFPRSDSQFNYDRLVIHLLDDPSLDSLPGQTATS